MVGSQPLAALPPMTALLPLIGSFVLVEMMLIDERAEVVSRV